MKDQLLALVRYVTDAKQGQMTLDRLGPDTYPDPTKTSYNDMVQWRVSLTFGRGYFQGAMVRFLGKWTRPHETSQRDAYTYAETERDLPVEEAVDTFLSHSIPDWALPR